MKKIAQVLLIATFAFLCTAAPVVASAQQNQQSWWGWHNRKVEHPRPHQRPRPRQWVPEFDPATAGAVATVIAGGAVLLARRKKSR